MAIGGHPAPKIGQLLTNSPKLGLPEVNPSAEELPLKSDLG
jgi:hypothetical protein